MNDFFDLIEQIEKTVKSQTPGKFVNNGTQAAAWQRVQGPVIKPRIIQEEEKVPVKPMKEKKIAKMGTGEDTIPNKVQAEQSDEMPDIFKNEPVIRPKHGDGCIRIDLNSARQGIIMSEILGAPVSRRRHR